VLQVAIFYLQLLDDNLINDKTTVFKFIPNWVNLNTVVLLFPNQSKDAPLGIIVSHFNFGMIQSDQLLHNG